MNDADRFERDRAIIGSSSFDSHGHGILYSGPGNHDRALDAAGSSDAVPIDHTQGGLQLAEPNRYQEYDDFTKADDINREASEKYCSELNGNVDTYVVGASEDRIFRDTEQEILVNNESVESINGVPREEIKELHDKDPEAAFNRICETELERDRSAAEVRGDADRLDDVANREQLYQEQLEKQGRTPETATEPQASEEVEASAPEEPAEEADQAWKQDLGEGIADRHQETAKPAAEAEIEETAEAPSSSASAEASEGQPSWKQDLGEGIADREPPPPPPPPQSESESMSM